MLGNGSRLFLQWRQDDVQMSTSVGGRTRCEFCRRGGGWLAAAAIDSVQRGVRYAVQAGAFVAKPGWWAGVGRRRKRVVSQIAGYGRLCMGYRRGRRTVSAARRKCMVWAQKCRRKWG